MSCLKPFYLTKEPNDGLPVPCGKCPECLKRRISGWSFRLMNEAKHSRSAYFITLTYDTNEVNISENGFLSLSKPDVQKFFKRLRKAHEVAEGNNCEKPRERGISYYVTGEYGTNRKRPHYHVILFNAELELMISKKDLNVIKMFGFDSRRQVDISIWGKGKGSIGTVDENSVGYALKYMQKERWKPMHERDDRVPEFSLFSKRLGSSYLSSNMIAWHMQDPYNRMYVNLMDGKKIAMPRYYKDKIFGEELRKDIGEYLRAELLKKEGSEISHRDYAEAVKAAYLNMYRRSAEMDRF